MVTRHVYLILLIAALLPRGGWGADALPANAPDSSNVPGTVIDYSPASSASYIGSPSLVVLADGSFIASHDLYGPGSDKQTTKLFASSDQGKSWSPLGVIKGQWCSTLFVQGKSLFIMGLSRELGHVVIRKSDDAGKTWTQPKDAASGVLRADGQFACAPGPAVEHGGRIWLAMEDAKGPGAGARAFRCFMMSAAADADLLDAQNWTSSNALAADSHWLSGRLAGWMDGNAVVTPEDKIVDVLHVAGGPNDESCAIVQISEDGKTAVFNSKTGFVAFPGGSKKFTIRADPQDKQYWSLGNFIPQQFAGLAAPSMTRNTLALVSSGDLQSWSVRCVVLADADVAKHAFGNADWKIDGDDMIAVSRTATDDGSAGANSAINCNFLTFHRISGFRKLTMSDSKSPAGAKALNVDAAPPFFQCPDFSVDGTGMSLGQLKNGNKAFANRAYTWQNVPAQLDGWQYTRFGAQLKTPPVITVKARRRTTIFAFTAPIQEGIDLTGWQKVNLSFNYSDGDTTQISVYQHDLDAGQELKIPQGNFSGMMVLLPPGGGGQ